MPKVSVVIPTYNRAHLIRRAIESVLNQTYQDFEIIVVDDGSTDNTEKVVRSFEDKRIRYIRHERNKGYPKALNTGITVARGEYIAFLDDDDEWLPTKLEKQTEKFEKVPDKVGLIYSGAEVREREKNVIQKTYYPEFKGDVRVRLLLGPMICGSHTALIKKECFAKVGLFNEALKTCQDWDMWKRISDYYEFDFVPEVLSRTYLHNFQMSGDLDALILGKRGIIEKYSKQLDEHPKILVEHLKGLGKLYCIKGIWKEAIRYFGKAVRINIFQIIKILLWCIIELPKSKRRNRYRIRKN